MNIRGLSNVLGKAPRPRKEAADLRGLAPAGLSGA